MTTLDQLRKYVVCDLTTNTHTQPNQHLVRFVKMRSKGFLESITIPKL